MGIATTLRYRLINLNHFRRCMVSRMTYQLSSYGKKGVEIPVFDMKPASLSPYSV
jgi:ribosomal protein S3